MKQIILKLSFILIGIFVLVSCEENDIPQIDAGTEGVQFEDASRNVTVPSDEDLVVTLPVTVTNVSSQERTYNVQVDQASTALEGSYSVGTAVIPAGSYEGTVEVVLSSEPLADGELYTLMLNLEAPDNGVTLNDGVTINYNKEIVCNDYVVKIVTDAYAEETSWDIKDSEGNVVASGPEVPYGPAASAESRGKEYFHNVYLEDGCYTFTIYDAYADGQNDGGYEGSYEVTCSILTVASGTGSFGATEKTDFCVNQ